MTTTRPRMGDVEQDQVRPTRLVAEAAPPPAAIWVPARACVPTDLLERAQWVCWHHQFQVGRWKKPPIDPRRGNLAKTNDPATWADFETARRVAMACGWGVGYVLCADDPFVGIDLDECRDPASGRIDEVAAEVVRLFASYTEISPSGDGLHVWVRGTYPIDGRGRKRTGVEVYDRDHYITVTGQRLPDAPLAVRARKVALGAFADRFFPLRPTLPTGGKPATPGGHHRGGEQPAPRLSDEEVLRRIRASKVGARFDALFDRADLSKHKNDWSAADLALCCYLAFLTRDPDQIDRLFRQSALYRPVHRREKWHRTFNGPSGPTTYGEWTVRKALKVQTKHQWSKD